MWWAFFFILKKKTLQTQSSSCRKTKWFRLKAPSHVGRCQFFPLHRLPVEDRARHIQLNAGFYMDGLPATCAIILRGHGKTLLYYLLELGSPVCFTFTHTAFWRKTNNCIYFWCDFSWVSTYWLFVNVVNSSVSRSFMVQAWKELLYSCNNILSQTHCRFPAQIINQCLFTCHCYRPLTLHAQVKLPRTSEHLRRAAAQSGPVWQASVLASGTSSQPPTWQKHLKKH